MSSDISVSHIATLANIPITPEEDAALSAAFEETLAVVAQLQDVDVSNVAPTYQVTGLENVLREDVVDEENMFPQVEALANAQHTHDGYVVVPQIIAQE